MKRSCLLCLVAIVLLLAGCTVIGQLSSVITAESTESQTISVGDAAAVEVTNFAGVVEISEGAPGEVVATVTKQSRLKDQAAAEAQLDDITWSLTETGTGARLLVEGPENLDNLEVGMSAHLVVAIPPGSDLTVNLGAGDVTIDQPSGNVTFNGGAGEVTVILPADASFNLRVTGGVAEIDSEFEGVPGGGVATDVEYTVGSDPTQTLTFQLGAGDIILQKAP